MLDKPTRPGLCGSNDQEKAMSEGMKQPVGLTIKNEGQDSQKVVFARLDAHSEGGPHVLDEALLEPGQEIQTTLGDGIVVQLASPPAAANDENA